VACRRTTKREIDSEYWVKIARDGRLPSDRFAEELLRFDAIHKRIPDTNAFVALWIEDHSSSGCVQRESFGHAFFDGEKMIGKFVDSNKRPVTFVGGFYVLAASKETMKNPFEFVRQDNWQLHRLHSEDPGTHEYPAKVTSWQKNEAWFGSVDVERRHVRGVDYRGRFVEINGNADQSFYNNHVAILVKQQPIEDGESEPAAPSRVDFNQNSAYETDGDFSRPRRAYRSHPTGEERREIIDELASLF